MAGDLPFVFPRAKVQGSPSQKNSLCVYPSPSVSLSLFVPQLAPLCGLLFWSFMRTLLLLLLLVFLFTSSAHFAAFSPASAPFGAIVLVKLTICIQLRYALCPAADEARLSSQKYAQDAHSDSSLHSPSLSLPLPLCLPPSPDALCICGLIYFHLLCHNNLYSFFFFRFVQYLCRYIRICCCSCWLLNAIAATNLIWP